MNPTRWAKISEIIETALEKDESERSIYLAQVCGEDTALREEIDSLLSFEKDNSNQLFDNQPLSQIWFETEQNLTNTFIGKQIGKYKITRLLGEGGMGAVFLAERSDGEFEQQVAVKLLKQGFITNLALSRFVSERQILARLHHRFIAQLLDGGTTEEGMPYLVMEYIEGLALLDFCDQHNLDLKSRLELFQKICSAVQYAHQHLVIHRDLKPNNIMITADGAPKLLDFGISKLVSADTDNLQTQTEFRALTPSYASPEQVKGDSISTSSDVYSLGVILYELLTGQRPYQTDSKNFSEIVRAICEDEPIRPSLVRSGDLGARRNTNETKSETQNEPGNPKSKIQNPKLLDGDLDNIILMVLRKESERRYASVEDLSKDISNYLNGLPVSARPNTFLYRASKFYARNKTASIIGLFLAFSLIAGIVGTTWQAVKVSHQRDRAEKRFRDVRQLSNSLLFEIAPKIERLEGSTEAREILVKRALEYLDSLSTESQDDLDLQSELASAYEKVGDVQGNPAKANLGDLQGGIETLKKAQKIRLVLHQKKSDDVQTQKLLGANYNLIGDFRWWASDVEGAMADYEKSTAIFEKLKSGNSNDLPTTIDLLTSKGNKIKVISYNGNYEESVKQYQLILQEVEKFRELFPHNIELKRMEGLNLIRIAYDLSWLDRYDMLDQYVKKSFVIYEPLLASNPNDARIRRDLYYAYFQAGGIYVEADPVLARQYLEKSTRLAKESVEKDKLNYQAKHDLAQGYSKLGEVSVFQKQFPEAVEFLKKAETILSELTVAEPKHEGYKFTLANNFGRLAAAQTGALKFQAAISNYQKAIFQHQQLYEADSNNNMGIRAMAIAQQDAAAVFEKMNDSAGAFSAYQKSVEMFNLLEQKGALSEYDKKSFEASQKALQRLRKN